MPNNLIEMKLLLLSVLLFLMAFMPYIFATAAPAVGSIPAEFNVSPTGAATYEIPIECPTGVGGLKPELKFVYNSQMGDGLMGCGWTVGGLSAITRVSKSVHIDGSGAGVEYTKEDALSLDGMRLIKVKESGDSAEYVTEQNINARIVGYNAGAKGFREFKVYTKEGRVLTFSGTAADGGGYGWPLTEICDSNGNYITFDNITSYGGDMKSLKGRVTYGKNKSGAGFESVIEFEFERTPNPVRLYVGGRLIEKWLRLKNVRVLNGVTPVSEYVLTYKDGGVRTDRSRLAGISYSKGGVSLEATRFTWTEDSYCIRSVKAPQKSSLSTWRSLLGVSLGDITGDGLTDKVYLLKDESNVSHDHPLVVCNGMDRVMERKVSGGHYGCESMLLYDIDHDGVDEVIATYTSTYGSGKQSGSRLTHYVGKYDQVSGKMVWKPLDESADTKISGTASTWYKRRTEVPGDFYGDGTLQYVPIYHAWRTGLSKSDIIRMILTGNSSGYTVSGDGDSCTIARKASGRFPSTDGVKSYVNCGFRVVNVNGNSKADLMEVSKGGEIRFYEEKEGSFTEIMSGALKSDGKNNVYAGDFNGDGNTDFLLLRGGKAVVNLSTGTDFVGTEMGDALKTTKKSSISVLDVNSDGRSDILVTDSLSVGLYVCTGDCFVQVASSDNCILNPNDSEEDRISKHYPPVSEINDGSEGLRYLECLDGIVELSPSKVFNKIVKIEDGLRNTISLSYDKAVSSGAPDVVKTVSKSTSRGRTSDVSYDYSGALYDSRNHSFMCYGTVKSTDAVSGRELSSQYRMQHRSAVPYKSMESAGGKALRSVTYGYLTEESYDGRVYQNQLDRQTERDELTGLERAVTYRDYDEYGNPRRIYTCNGKHNVLQEIEYVKAGSWCPSRPASVKSLVSLGGVSERRERKSEYDARGNLVMEEEGGLVTRYSDYDVFGNCQTVRYGTGDSERTEKFTYTVSGRHVQSKTDALGERITYSWDAVNDRLQHETDSYGHRTTYKYNSLGEVIQTITPTSVSKYTERHWAEEGNPYNASYYVEERTDGYGSVKTWYTSDGRELCRESYGLGGKKIYVVREYNADGTLSKISRPSFESAPTDWAEQYEYDTYGRVVKVTRPSGVTEMSYKGLTSTITSPRDVITKTFTAEGWTESVTTNGKTVRYTYYPDGKVKTAAPDGGVAVYMEYDKQGNRTLISEADGGVVKTTYNEFGELVESSRKQGGRTLTTTYTYSPEGLLMQKNCSGALTVYKYDSRNRLIQESLSGGVSQSYEYDSFDRITKVTDVIDGKSFARKTSYDGYGRVSRETYPSGYYTENIYDENGMLALVRDADGNDIYKPLTANAMGQILTESRGGVVTRYEYDKSGNMSFKRCGDVIHHMYIYDTRGNLERHMDGLTAQVSRYGYDAQNRLTSWEVYKGQEDVATVSDRIEYDDRNNMVRRSVLGDYTLRYEDENHPHALSSIDGVPDVMPKEEQNITYTDFGKVESVTEGERRYGITYNPNEQRVKTEYTTGKGNTVRYYSGNYEEVTDTQGNTTKIHYLKSGAMMIEKGGERTLYYNYTDRLGSIVATTDASGNVLERYAYDPWGRRVKPYNWSEADTRTDLLNNRGFTGHEHIDGMSLINMNGRVYDPLIGMFLSLDPFIQAPDNWLNYNRYMYCFGNPLSYTDPSGNIGVLATIGIGAAIGAVVSAAYGLAKGVGDGLTGWNLAKSTLVSAGIGAALGAVSAAASYAVSYLVSTGTFMGYFSAGAIMGTQWGAYGGFVYGSAVGAQGWDLIKYVAIGAGVGAVVGGVIGAGCYAANLVASRIYANNNNHCLTVRLENTGHVLNYKELYAYMKLDSGVKLDGASMSQVFSDSSEFSIVANELCYEDGYLKPITMDVGSLTMYGKFKLGLTYGCFTFGCGVVNTAGVFAYRALDQLLIK